MKVDYGKARCQHCGEWFKRMSGNQIFCSKECQAGAQRATRDRVDAKIYEGGEWIECAYCGEWFKRAYKSRRLYCCEECEDDAKNERYREFLGGKRKGRGRRAKKDTTGKDGFTWAQISAVLGEFKISSYNKAVEILTRRANGEIVEP